MVKKLAAVLAFASCVVAPVLVAPAQADDAYTAGVRTSCGITVPAVVKRGTAPTIRVDVRPNGPAQGIRPEGDVRVTLSKAGSRIFTEAVAYNGSPVTVRGPVLTQTGRYQVEAHFETADGSVFKSCSGSAAFELSAGLSPDDIPDGGPDAGTTDPAGLLPNTGGPDLLWLLLALALLGGGSGLVYTARRRPPVNPYEQ